MKNLFILVLSFTLLSTMSYAVDKVESMPLEKRKILELIKETRVQAKKGASAKSRFCCNSSGGYGCYVFGKASCSNCDSFCGGSSFVSPWTEDELKVLMP